MADNYSLSKTSSRTTQDILNKAAAMKNITWVPTQDLIGWNNLKTFNAGNTYTGIPYSQKNQVDEIGFVTALTASDFYQNTTIDGKTCPRYGVDCAKYVCYSLGISLRYTGALVADLKAYDDKTIGNEPSDIEKVGSYNAKSLVKSELFSAYAELVAGNAVVYNDGKLGHAMLILSNSPSSNQVVVYETQNTVPIVSLYTYSTLWSKRYMPFKLK